MKRYFSFALLLALMLSIFSLSYADTVQVGSGTSTTSYLPFYGFYHYGYSQQIYTQAQINTAGTISKIRFYYVSGNIDKSKDWTIYMGHTQKTEFSSTSDWEAPANLSQVFDGDVSPMLPATNNWMEITLQTPFNYNNEDNLLIAVYQSTPGYAAMSWGGFTSGTNTGLYFYSDTTNPDPTNPPTSGNYLVRTSTINRIHFVFPNTSAPLAPVLTGPANGGYLLAGERLTWTPTIGEGDANGYSVYLGTDADPPLVASNVTATSYLPTVQPGTTYYWKVVANNEIGSSPASEVWSFITPGADQLVESFEGDFPPVGWDAGGWLTNTTTAYHRSKSTSKSGSSSTQYTLSTPMVAIEDGSTLQFWNRCSSTNGILQVVYSTDRTNWTQLGSDITYAASSTWYAQNIDLSSLTPGNYYLGFRTGLASGTHYLDLVIGPDIAAIAPGVPELSDPADEAVDVSVTPTLTWTCASIGGVPTHYNVYCDTSPTPTTLIGTSTTTSFTIETALPYSTTYYWTVTAENATGTSAPAAPRSFTTAPHPVVSTFPWNQDFTSTTFPPIYWNRYSGLYPTDPLIPTTAGWGRGNFANISDPANLSARINIYGTVCKYWLVTPEIVIPAGDYQLCFDLALTRYNSTTAVDPAKQLDDKFIVLIADNPTMANATALKLWDNAGSPFVYNSISNTGESQIVGLGGHTGSRYIAFYGESTSSSGNNGGDNHLFVDNVQVRETPASPIFTYTPDTIDFGEVSYNISSAATNVTVTNTGAGVLSLNASDISIIGANAADFSFGTANLPASLTAGQYVDIPVTVQSTTEGPISATLRIAYGGVNYDVALSANVLPQGNFFIGDGTAYNSNTANPTPYGGYYKNGREQYIVTAAELTALGAQAGLISSIGFNVQNPNTSANLPNFTIRIGTTDATEFANNTFLTGLSEVFSVAAYTPTAGWNGHTLNTPFAWDGVSNLVVQTSYDLFEGSYLRNASCYYTTTPVQRALYYRHDSTAWNTVSTGTPSYDRPNMKLFIAEPVEGMPDVPVLTSPDDGATGLPKYGFELTWTLGDVVTHGIPDGYAVLMSTDVDNIYDDLRWETTNTYFNPVTEGGVDFVYNQRYYWTVAAYNIHGEAVVETPRSFVIETDPTIVALPYEENFDEVTAPALPRAWMVYKSNAASNLETRTTYSQTPENSVYMYTRVVDETMRLITPPIAVPINTIKLSFWLRTSSTTNYSMKVGTVSALDETGVFTQVAEIIPTVSGQFVQYEVSFANYTGTDDFICFQPGTAATYRTYYLDSVRMEALPAVDMEAVSIAGPTLATAGQQAVYDVTVLNFGSGAVSDYTVNLKDSEGTLLGTATVAEAIAPNATAAIPVTWTPAAAGTYQVYGEVVAAGDADATNNQSSTIGVYVIGATDEYMALGDPETTTTTYELPINIFYRSSVTEELYFPDEMHLQSGTISDIVYKNNFANNREDVAIKIYMKHTTVEDLSAGWLPIDATDLVFDGTVDMPAGVNNIVIPLTTPFNYTGGVLATRVFRVRDADGSLSSSDKFYYTNTPDHANRSRYVRSDDATYDPLAPSGAGTMSNYMPNTTFVVQNPVWMQSVTLSGYVYEADGTTPIEGANVNLTERSSTTTNSEGYYEFTFWEARTVTAAASKFAYYTHTVENIELTPGNDVQQNFILNAMPRVTVSGVVNTNDIPGGVEGAKIKLTGIENHEVFSGAGGVFSIADVLGSNEGIPYTVTITLADYQGYSGAINVMETALNMGTITLNEFTWPAYNLVATRSGDNAVLNWDAAEAPQYYFWDFEADNGDWISGGYGDWEWSNTYPAGGTFNWTEYQSSCVPPTAAHSGTGLWGTRLYTNYSNSGAWSYLTNTVDLTGIENPQLRYWRWNNLNGSYDYYWVEVSANGTDWTTVLTENAVNNAWAEKVVDLSAYANQNLHVRFAMYASSVVSYAGLYIDDVYIGNPPAEGKVASRALENYSVYRFPIAEEATPDNWTQLATNVSALDYTDTGFGALAPGGYKWAVKANYTGSLTSDAVISNKLGILADITEFQITRSGDNVELTWAAQDGADFYRIYSSDDPYGTFTLLGTSDTASFSTAAGAAMKFFKVTAVTGEVPAPAGRSKN